MIRTDPAAAPTGWGPRYLALGLVALGILGLVYRDFALQWEPVPQWVPARAALAIGAAVVLLSCGIGLLVDRTSSAASRVLIAYVALWVLLLKVPRVVASPLVEQSWLGLGEIAVVLAGAWMLVARRAPAHGTVRPAQVVFGAALIPVGLSHLFYLKATSGLVPAWLPFRTGWAAFTGVAHIAAGLAVLVRVMPVVASRLEAWMITAFTVLVWLPKVVSRPTARLNWTAFAISWIIGAGAWVVADSYRWPAGDARAVTGTPGATRAEAGGR